MTPFSAVADALDRLSKLVIAAETFAIQGDYAKRDKSLQQASAVAVDALEFLPFARHPQCNVVQLDPRARPRPTPDQPGSAA